MDDAPLIRRCVRARRRRPRRSYRYTVQRRQRGSVLYVYIGRSVYRDTRGPCRVSPRVSVLAVLRVLSYFFHIHRTQSCDLCRARLTSSSLEPGSPRTRARRSSGERQRLHASNGGHALPPPPRPSGLPSHTRTPLYQYVDPVVQLRSLISVRLGLETSPRARPEQK